MRGCDSCSDLHSEWPIRSPGELAKAIRVVRANLDKATLYLVDALRSMSADDARGLTSLGTLLRLVGEQSEILDHFRLMLMQDAPPVDAIGTASEAQIPASRLFRSLALAERPELPLGR